YRRPHLRRATDASRLWRSRRMAVAVPARGNSVRRARVCGVEIPARRTSRRKVADRGREGAAPLAALRLLAGGRDRARVDGLRRPLEPARLAFQLLLFR